jgi:hypothetical protein
MIDNENTANRDRCRRVGSEVDRRFPSGA